MAFNLEKNYSKEEILELYVNSIYLETVTTAWRRPAKGYFGKAPPR